MGMNAFLEIPGVKGSARQQHVKDLITVHGVVAEVRADLSWTTGRPEPDKSKHKPIVITKEFDLASPALQTALKVGTTFEHVRLQFWRMPPGGGTEEPYYTIRMSEVKVVGIQLDMPNNRRPENDLLPELEHVSFSYTGISYTFAAGPETAGHRQEGERRVRCDDRRLRHPGPGEGQGDGDRCGQGRRQGDRRCDLRSAEGRGRGAEVTATDHPLRSEPLTDLQRQGTRPWA
jgi:type VI secretion system secreted protein Hcp